MVKILQEIKEAKRIAIAGHVKPDGDCTGSCLALFRYLKQNTSAEVKLYLEYISPVFAYLAGSGSVSSFQEAEAETEPADLFFSLDCGDESRLGAVLPFFEKAAQTVCIDHHISNTAFAQINHVVPDASSTSEVLYELMEEELIDREIAECLYTGLLHDTGVFHHSCSARTMQIAGILMAKGVDYPRIIDESFYQKTYMQNQLIGRCLLESMLMFDGTCIVSYVTRSTLDFFGATVMDLEGVVDNLRQTKGVEVAIFVYETAQREFKVSMRSNGEINVNKIAVYFGGGGHLKAAGCTINGTKHDVINNITKHIEVQLKELQKIG